jgi:hypothetical protein
VLVAEATILVSLGDSHLPAIAVLNGGGFIEIWSVQPDRPDYATSRPISWAGSADRLASPTRHGSGRTYDAEGRNRGVPHFIHSTALLERAVVRPKRRVSSQFDAEFRRVSEPGW